VRLLTVVCTCASTKLAFLTRLLFPLITAGGWSAIQAHDCSSKSPALRHQVKRITREEVSKSGLQRFAHYLHAVRILNLPFAPHFLRSPCHFLNVLWLWIPYYLIHKVNTVVQMCVLFTVVSLCIVFSVTLEHMPWSLVYVIIIKCMFLWAFLSLVNAGKWSADSASWPCLYKSCPSAQGEKED